MTTKRTKAVEMVAAVINDGSRIDRFLRVAADGHYYTSPDKTFLTNDGPETPPHVAIPVGEDITEQDAEEWAEALLGELDAKVSESSSFEEKTGAE
jgi:hypothetical protein